MVDSVLDGIIIIAYYPKWGFGNPFKRLFKMIKERLDENYSAKQKLFGWRAKPNLIEIYTGSPLMEIIDVNWTRFGRAAAR